MINFIYEKTSMKLVFGGERFHVISYNMFHIDDHFITHSRTCYGFFDLFAEYGGVRFFIYFVVAILLGPFAEHSFLIMAIQKMYMVRTKTEYLFSWS